jgi:hypothetical protein
MGRGECYALMALTGKDSMVRCWVLRDCFGGSFLVLCQHPFQSPQIYPRFKFKNFTCSCSIFSCTSRSIYFSASKNFHDDDVVSPSAHDFVLLTPPFIIGFLIPATDLCWRQGNGLETCLDRHLARRLLHLYSPLSNDPGIAFERHPITTAFRSSTQWRTDDKGLFRLLGYGPDRIPHHGTELCHY